MGYNQESRDKEGISRNTVVGNVEIGKSSGDEINRDISKSNETTRDDYSRTDINVESQTIEYAVNPDKLKEDIGKAKQEIADVTRAFKESINDRGDDNRNFFGQLREMRLNETIDNIAGERLNRASTQKDIKDTLEAAYKDLGYDVEIRFSTPSETPELKGKGGTAYVGDDGKHTVIINSGYLNGKTKGEILGVISEEASHVINGAEGRQISTGTDEKGLESTGRATNEYFQDKYKDDDTTISLTSERSIDTSKLGTNVGDDIAVYHGGGPGKKEGVEGLLDLLDYPGYISAEEINHNGIFDFIGIRVHNSPDNAANLIENYMHKNKDLRINYGYSMSSDGLMIAAGKNNMEKSDELISVFGRISYIEKNLPKITKETTDKIFIVTLEGDHVPIWGYGDKSTKKMENVTKRMVKKGELIPKGDNIYENKYGVEVIFIKMYKNETKHGGVTRKALPGERNEGLEILVKKLKDAGSKIPIDERRLK